MADALDALGDKYKIKKDVPKAQPIAKPTPDLLPKLRLQLSGGELGSAAITAAQDLAAPIKPILGGAARVAGTGVGKAFDIVNRASEANQARVLRGAGAGASTFVHSEAPEQYSADTSELARRSTGINLNSADLVAPGTAEGPFGDLLNKLPSIQLTKELTPDQYAKLPGIERGALEFLTQLRYDPTTYLGGSGFLKNFMERIGLKGLPMFSRSIEALEASENPTVRMLGKTVRGTYKVLNYKGESKLRLAAKNGEEGIQQWKGLKSIKNRMLYQKADLGNTLVHQYRDITKGLTSADENVLNNAIHTGTVSQLPANLAIRAYSFKKVTDALAHLEATPALIANLKKEGFDLPQTLKRFESEEPRNLQGTEQYRGHYMPTARSAKDLPKAGDVTNEEAKNILGLNEPALEEERNLPHDLRQPRSLIDIIKGWEEEHAAQKATKGLSTEDPNLLRREGKDAKLLSPALQRKVVEARLRGGAAAISAADAEKAITKLFGVDTFEKAPAAAKEFFRETYKNLEDRNFWAHLLKGSIDIPKVGLFALPFRHAFNIGSLSILADPTIANITGTVGKYSRLMLALLNKEDRSRILQDTGKNVLQKGKELLSRPSPEMQDKILGKSAKYGVSHVPSFDRATATTGSGSWLGRIPLVGYLYKSSNHALWTFDDAAKATRFDRLLKGYMKQGIHETNAAYKAADEVGAELINYNERSPLTEALSYIFPFAAFRTKAPAAIAKLYREHPERIAATGRLSPAMVGDVQDTGTQNNEGTEQGVESYLPLAESMRIADNPFSYLRGAAGWPVSMAISKGLEGIQAASGDYNPYIADYMTYGKSPDLRYAANANLGSFPFGEAALGAIGQGEFANQGNLSGALRGQTGLGIVSGPNSEQTQAATQIANLEQQIAYFQSQGDTVNAENSRRLLETYKRKHYVWVK